MDIIFQSGEFYSQESTLGFILKLLLPLLGALISGGIAIWIFNKGISKRREEEEEKQARRLDELKEYTLTLLRLLKGPIDKQIAYYQKFSNDLESSSEISYTLEYAVGLSTKNFNSVDRKDLYRIFVTNGEGSITTKAESYQELTTQIKYIESVERSSKDLLEYFMGEHKVFVNQWQDNISEIAQKKNNMAVDANESGRQLGSDRFLDEIVSIYNKWQQIDGYKQRHVAAKELLIPLERACKNHSNDPRATDILHCCGRCSLAFENLEHLKRYVIEITDKRAEGLKSAQKKILTFSKSSYDKIEA